MQIARHTKPEGHFKVWATIIFVQRPLPPIPRAETGLPLLQSIALTGPKNNFFSLTCDL